MHPVSRRDVQDGVWKSGLHILCHGPYFTGYWRYTCIYLRGL
jgi:hypothetical protein